MTPHLSVIIPTYKRTNSLEKLLDCLSVQENIVLEVIVVNQNPPQFFQGELAVKLSKVVHIMQDTPNVSLARNTGFKKATAPYILFLDDDLVPHNSFCFEGISVFSKFTSIKSFIPLVYTETGKKISYNRAKKKFIIYYDKNSEIFSITDAMSAAVFFEKSYFELTGGFDVHLFEFAKTSEDQEFFLRMKQRKLTLWFVPFIEIFHDEKVTGGCELRTSGYWNTRRKCIKAVAFRYRIHKKIPGRLSIVDLMHIAHSSFLNREIIFSGVLNMIKEFKLMVSSIKESKYYFLQHKDIYSSSPVSFIDK